MRLPHVIAAQMAAQTAMSMTPLQVAMQHAAHFERCLLNGIRAKPDMDRVKKRGW
jgi:hypothetical protein